MIEITISLHIYREHIKRVNKNRQLYSCIKKQQTLFTRKTHGYQVPEMSTKLYFLIPFANQLPKFIKAHIQKSRNNGLVESHIHMADERKT